MGFCRHYTVIGSPPLMGMAKISVVAFLILFGPKCPQRNVLCSHVHFYFYFFYFKDNFVFSLNSFTFGFIFESNAILEIGGRDIFKRKGSE